MARAEEGVKDIRYDELITIRKWKRDYGYDCNRAVKHEGIFSEFGV